MTTATDSSPNSLDPSTSPAAAAPAGPSSSSTTRAAATAAGPSSSSTTPAAASSAVLPRIFAIDRAFAAASAVGLVVGGVLIADLLDWPTWVVMAIGAGLAPYAHLLHTICRRGAYRSGLARFTAFGDAAWVVASIALLAGRPDATSTVGTWIIAVVAAAVADIGLVKLYGWSRR